MLVAAAIFPSLTAWTTGRSGVDATRADRAVGWLIPSYAPGVRVLRVPDGRAAGWTATSPTRPGCRGATSRSSISDGRLTVGGAPLRANTIVGAGTELRLDVPEPVALDLAAGARDRAVDVVYEDDDLLIVDKPAGLVVHPAPGHAGDTLVNALLAHGDGDLGRDRRRPATGHRPSPRPRHERAADGRPDTTRRRRR